ncbi:NACHT nucleoside triphosphatase [Penicillium riverlandense]|uniref:NACHT nucleoside triphosphatase n=1 Tax=Penicillium riverlandense TaxID=1903569 RepID=UPI0025488E07|nr:NACHT nucleoside triphosphatase [Penicillium riverlandense]KAJ5812293.1 NACHT nucleoside triphosphatase [Penicillium riverlandense]
MRLYQLRLKNRLDVNPRSFLTWIRLHDMDSLWNAEVAHHRPITTIALPLYYVAMLGIESVLECILAIDIRDTSVIGTVNAQGRELGNAL